MSKNIQVPLLLLMRPKEGSEDHEGVLAIDFGPSKPLGALSEPVTIPKGQEGSAPALIIAAAANGLSQAWETFKAHKEGKETGNFTFSMPGGAKA